MFLQQDKNKKKYNNITPPMLLSEIIYKLKFTHLNGAKWIFFHKLVEETEKPIKGHLSHTLRSHEYRKWLLTKQALDCYKNYSYKHHRQLYG